MNNEPLSGRMEIALFLVIGAIVLLSSATTVHWILEHFQVH